MKRRRLEKALKKRLRVVKARLNGESTKGMPKLTWRERQALARAGRVVNVLPKLDGDVGRA